MGYVFRAPLPMSYPPRTPGYKADPCFFPVLNAETIFSLGSSSLPVIKGFIYSFLQYINGFLNVNALLEITSLTD